LRKRRHPVYSELLLALDVPHGSLALCVPIEDRKCGNE
jgi:hypothetical protein